MKKLINKSFYEVSFILLALFSFIAPLKLGLPYTYNVEPSVPYNWNEIFIMSWPAEWGILLLSISLLFYLGSILFRDDYVFHIGVKGGLLICFMITSCLSVLFNSKGYVGLTTEVLFLSYGAYYFLLKQFNLEEQKKKIILFLILTAFSYCVFYGIYQFLEGLDQTLKFMREMGAEQLQNSAFYNRIIGKKIFSTFIYSNSFAGYLLVLIPLTIAAFLEKEKRKIAIFAVISGGFLFFLFLTSLQHFSKIWYYTASLLFFPISLFFILLKTKSEGALLSFFASISVFIAFFLKNTFKKQKIINSLIIVISVVTIFLVQKEIIKKVYLSIEVRLQYNQASLAIIKDNFLFGAGPGSYGTQYMHYKLPDAEEVQLAHNSFLQIFSELGVFPFILIILFIFLLLKNLGKEKTHFQVACYLSLISVILHNLIDFDLYVPAIGFTTFYLFSLFKDDEYHIISYKKNIILKLGLLIFLGLISSLIIFYINISKSFYFRESGNRFLEKGKIFMAVRNYEKAVKYFPDSPSNRIKAADTYLQAKNSKKALEHYKEALNLSPDNAMTWLKYARCLYYYGIDNHNIVMKDILTAYKNAIRFYPSNQISLSLILLKD